MYWVSVIDMEGRAIQVFRDTMPNVLLFIKEFGPYVSSVAIMEADERDIKAALEAIRRASSRPGV